MLGSTFPPRPFPKAWAAVGVREREARPLVGTGYLPPLVHGTIRPGNSLCVGTPWGVTSAQAHW
eukprot:7044286-Pyramimonas_sp.AAC.1